jgi:hypothetical protein
MEKKDLKDDSNWGVLRPFGPKVAAGCGQKALYFKGQDLSLGEKT